MIELLLVSALVLPTEFLHNRVFLVPETEAGEVVRFYTDTGGGWNAITSEAAARIGAPAGDSIAFPVFAPDRSIPAPPPYFQDGRLAVGDDAAFGGGDGFLGARWHADRVLEWDYPNRTLRVLETFSTDQSAVALGFQVDEQGARTMHFPRMQMIVDGEPFEMLLDTGATITLGEDAATAFALPADTEVGGSFIVKEVFDRWAAKHPDWLVLADGDRIQGHRMALIRVPEVTIGGHTVGPVWFAIRPDAAFRRYMAGMMDAPTDGALGGSAFQYLRMVVDYPNAKAYFFK